MSIHDDQATHLDAVIHWAERIRLELAPVLEAHAGRVHFRPSKGGVAMVSLLPERPQRGKSGVRDLKRLAARFDELFHEHCVDIAQGRPTAEKRLQSWLLADAYRHDRTLTALDADLVFITDELALPLADGRRIVCDIIALRREGPRFVPVVIELKTERQLSRLVEQVEGYAALVNAHRDRFEQLARAALGREVSFTGPCEKWIVWPMAGTDRDPREDELGDAGVRVVGYVEDDAGFRFRVGAEVGARREG